MDLVPIPGRLGYFVTRSGDVYSTWRRGWHYAAGPVFEPRKSRPTPCGKGYRSVSVGPGSKAYVHTLVLETFVGPRPTPAHEGCHGDNNPSNNAIDNLRWDTPSSNQLDRRGHGTSNLGEKNSQAKLRDAEVIEIRSMAENGTSVPELSRIFKRHVETIRDIVKRKTWSHI